MEKNYRDGAIDFILSNFNSIKKMCILKEERNTRWTTICMRDYRNIEFPSYFIDDYLFGFKFEQKDYYEEISFYLIKPDILKELKLIDTLYWGNYIYQPKDTISDHQILEFINIKNCPDEFKSLREEYNKLAGYASGIGIRLTEEQWKMIKLEIDQWMIEFV